LSGSICDTLSRITVTKVKRTIAMILVVDDDDNMGQSLERMLRYMGHDAVRVGRPMEALAFLRIRKPALIILDLDLPEMNGMTLLRAIRNDAANAGVVVVIHSSDFSAEKMKEALASGARDFIVKGTLGWEAMAARIKEYMGNGEAK
jgi:DNA-binding response OmpR family regulator